jgi:hypothetical protein
MSFSSLISLPQFELISNLGMDVVRHRHQVPLNQVLSRPYVFLRVRAPSSPKFVFLSDQFVECGNWGPTPAADRVLIARGKACGDLSAARAKVALSYQADPGCRIVVEELLDLIHIAVCAAP